jgi:pseudouridine synthase
VLADAGVAARRVCEKLIEEGHVRVNGQVVRRLPVFVNPEEDEIEVDGQRIRKPQRRVYLMLNKPAGTLVTSADEEGMDRPTILSLVNHPAAGRLFPVGRLDLDTTGLVLLTNDGDLANRLTHPRYGVSKTYHAVVRGGLEQADITAIGQKLQAMARRAAEEAGVPVRAAGSPKIAILRREDGRSLLEISLTEGGLGRPRRQRREGPEASETAQERNQLREALRTLGMPVKKLSRIAIGPLRLKGLAVGNWRELTREELSMLRKAGSRGPGSPAPHRSKPGRTRRARPADKHLRTHRSPRGTRP